jgi:hypothetical protein
MSLLNPDNKLGGTLKATWRYMKKLHENIFTTKHENWFSGQIKGLIDGRKNVEDTGT